MIVHCRTVGYVIPIHATLFFKMRVINHVPDSR